MARHLTCRRYGCPYAFHKSSNLFPFWEVLALQPHYHLMENSFTSPIIAMPCQPMMPYIFIFPPLLLLLLQCSSTELCVTFSLLWQRERERDMGRGRIEIRKIENATNRQVTYSKRRLGIMKKAKELTVLCDADVSIIMFSSTGKFAEYCSPSTDLKMIVDRYQQVSGVDIWKDPYERMQTTFRHLEEINSKLRREIRQKMGEDLDGLGVKELRGLEQSLDESLRLVRQRKYHVISTQTETYKRKLKSTHEAHRTLLHELEMKGEHTDYGFAVGDAFAMANGGPHMFAL